MEQPLFGSEASMACAGSKSSGFGELNDDIACSVAERKTMRCASVNRLRAHNTLSAERIDPIHIMILSEAAEGPLPTQGLCLTPG